MVNVNADQTIMKIRPPCSKSRRLIGTIAVAVLSGFTCSGYAQQTQMLHESRDGSRDNYTGVIGCEFKVGSTNVVVSHLGVYDNNGDGLSSPHAAGIFNSSGSAVVGQANFAAGTEAYLTNSVRWMPLDPPLLLLANTVYVLGSDVINGSGDPWLDSTTFTNWNSWFLGSNGATTRKTHYSAGGVSWPTFPASSFGSDSTYGNVTLGYIEIDRARVGVQSTTLATSVGQALNFLGFASGAPGIKYQWYKAPATLLTGKTNAVFSIASAAQTDSGTYYLTATNGLGGSKSANISVTVTAYPVGIQQGPTNQTVLGNYQATFSCLVTGSPPVSLQWLRNGTPIPGATSSSYSFAPTSANNSDQFSLLASNNLAGTSHTALSSAAKLTVIPNLALPQQFLHGAKTNLPANPFLGCLGGSFITGPHQTLVTHLGYYAANYSDASHADLLDDHTVYIFNSDYTTNASVVVAAGTSLPVVNGYVWAALNSPVTLAPDTTYILGADSSVNDPAGDAYAVSDPSSYYTDTNNAGSLAARYNNTGMAPYFGGYAGQMFSGPNMAILPVGQPSVWVTPGEVTNYAGSSITITGAANGLAPLIGQWYKAPGTLLPGQTNATLTLANPTVGDSGDYYLLCSNSAGTGQSRNATVTVLPSTAPIVITDLQSQKVLVHQTVTFGLTLSGPPPFTYQWTFNSRPITGATNSSLQIPDASAATAGSYRVAITNNHGWAYSAIATLAVDSIPWGSYPAAVMGADLLYYYRFSDVNSGLGVATNMGSLGFAYNGTYEGAYAATDGLLNVSHFGADNPAVSLDGLTSDILIPASHITVTNLTIAAWVYSGGGQPNDSAIFFHRGGSVFGLSVFPDDNTLKYTWDGGNYNFQTGLALPINKWAFVAMVITPTDASIYLHDGTGMQTTNNPASHGVGTLDAASYVGWDSAGGNIGRRWTGGVDEVMVFSRALPAVEINALYLGVRGSATLTITPSGNGLVLTWPGGTLQEADQITGPWTNNTGATSPYPVSSSGARKFYRVKLQP